MKGILLGIAAGLLVFGAVAWGAPAAAQSASEPGSGVSGGGEVQALRERAAAYWAARMAGDDKVQWELLEPRGRGRVTAQEYAAERRGLRYLGYQIETATIEGYFATVKVRLLFQALALQLAGVAPQTVLMDDHWIRVGGAWYRQLDDRRPQKAEP